MQHEDVHGKQSAHHNTCTTPNAPVRRSCSAWAVLLDIMMHAHTACTTPSANLTRHRSALAVPLTRCTLKTGRPAELLWTITDMQEMALLHALASTAGGMCADSPCTCQTALQRPGGAPDKVHAKVWPAC